MENINIHNKRLSKYLYSLGFPRECVVDNQTKKEYWVYEKSSAIQEALDFYFYMRKKNRM